MIGQCPKCGNWHTDPYFCPADLSNRGASEPLRDWRDAEIERLAAQVSGLQQAMDGVKPFVDKIVARLAEAERDMDQLIGERDHAQGMADKLADAIATLLGVEIGEHSNMNCPWEQALEAFEERAASTVTQDAAP